MQEMTQKYSQKLKDFFRSSHDISIEIPSSSQRSLHAKQLTVIDSTVSF